MQASQHQPDPTEPKSRLRFLIPGDVFARLCVETMRISDGLTDAARLLAQGELDTPTIAAIATHLTRANGHIGSLKDVLQAICDEGELTPEAAAVLS